jgi:hypothetical protein
MFSSSVKMKIEFDSQLDIHDDVSIITYVKWNGTYTVGNVGCRGTRVWFKSNNAKCLDGDFDESEEKSFHDKLNGSESVFPCDDYNLRSICLSDILKALKHDSKIQLKSAIDKESQYRYYDGNLDELLDELWSHNSDLAILIHEKMETDKELLNSYPNILIDMFTKDSVWLIKNKNRIIEELKEVLNMCNEKNVTWEWI